MKIYRNLVLFFLLLLTLTSCSDLLLGPDPKNTPQQNFDILWKEFDRYYCFFEHKQINWDSLYAVYRPYVQPTLSDREFLQTVSSLLDHLKDGHVNVYTPVGNYSYTAWRDRYRIVFQLNVILTKYLNRDYQTAGKENLIFGKLNKQMGYIHIRSFGGDHLLTTDFESIDQVLEELRDCRGIIVDVRGNGGGNPKYAEILASRFADRRRLFAYVRYRNGPRHSDFTDYLPRYIEPLGKFQFTDQVIVLTNRESFSATEYFVFAMKTFPHVTVIGDTTGGGFGNAITRELPNGWVYRVPRSVFLAPDSTNYEGIGIAPDIRVVNTGSDKVLGTDTQLSRAISFLEQFSN